MTPERHQQICQIFHRAVDCNAAERASFVRNACGEDADLMVAVQQLVSADTQAERENFLADSCVAGSTESPPEPWLVGRTIGSYEVLEWIAAGGMGAVYKARHLKLKTIVALKVLRPEHFSSQLAVDRFQQEMEVVGKLSHRNIVRALDAGEVDGIHYLSMEFVDGMDLGTCLRRRGRPPVATACDWVRQAALGLQSAWEANVIHRDVKPANLMLARDGTIKVLDLGIARLCEPDSNRGRLTQQGQLMGTLDYIAPEQIDNPERVDIRADIYSLGCTLFYLLTGRVVFPGNALSEKLRAHVSETAVPIRTVRCDVPEQLEAVVAKMIAKKPADRFATPAEVAAAVMPFCQPAARSGSASAARPRNSSQSSASGARVKPPRPRRLRNWVLGLLCVALLGTGGAAAVFVLQVQTKQGVLTIECPEGLSTTCQVLVDGDRVAVKPLDDKRAEVTIAVGEHGIEVRDGEKSYHSPGPITIVQNGQRFLTVHLDAGKETIAQHETKPALPAPAYSPTKPSPSPIQPPPPSEEKPAPPTEDPAPPAQDPLSQNVPAEGVRLNVQAKPTGGADDPALVKPEDPEPAVSDHPQAVARTLGSAISLPGKYSAVHGVAIAPDGQTALSSGSQWDEKLRYWDLEKRLLKAEWPNPGAYRCVLAFTPDGKFALSGGGQGGSDFVVRRWNVRTGKPDGAKIAAAQPVQSLAVSADGRMAAAGELRGTVRVWQTATGRPLHAFELGSRVTSLNFSASGKLLVTACEDRSVRTWDLETERQEAQFEIGSSGTVFAAFSPDGAHVVGVTSYPENVLRRWTTKDGKKVAEVKIPPALGAVVSACLSSDGVSLMTGHQSGVVALWDVATFDLMAHEKKHQRPVLSVAIAQRSQKAVSGCEDGYVWLWELVTLDDESARETK